MTHGKREAGYCPECGRIQRVDADGRMLAHMRLTFDGVDFKPEPCDGTRQLHAQHPEAE